MNKWLPLNTNLKEKNYPHRLFCFGYAGGAASIFATWQNSLPNIEVCAVQLPGRWERISEPFLTSIETLIPAIHDGLKLEIDRPFSILGYSAGTILAFEWARWLRKHNHKKPNHLFVMARGAPQLNRLYEPIYHLEDDDFLQRMQSGYGGIPDILLKDPEMRELFLPALKADMQFLDTYKFREEAPLPIPVTAIGGVEDKGVPFERLNAWKEMTTSKFEIHQMPGAHFFIQTQLAQVLKLVKDTLQSES